MPDVPGEARLTPPPPPAPTLPFSGGVLPTSQAAIIVGIAVSVIVGKILYRRKQRRAYNARIDVERQEQVRHRLFRVVRSCPEVSLLTAQR